MVLLHRCGVLVVLLLVILVAGHQSAARAGVPNPVGPQINAAAFSGHGQPAFVQNGTLYVLNGDTGALTALSQSGEVATYPRWSPDGNWVAYIDQAVRATASPRACRCPDRPGQQSTGRSPPTRSPLAITVSGWSASMRCPRC